MIIKIMEVKVKMTQKDFDNSLNLWDMKIN